MAGADYLDCGVCGCRALYDGGVDYEESECGDIAAICKKCVKKYEIVVRNKKTRKEKKRDVAGWLA